MGGIFNRTISKLTPLLVYISVMETKVVSRKQVYNKVKPKGQKKWTSNQTNGIRSTLLESNKVGIQPFSPSYISSLSLSTGSLTFPWFLQIFLLRILGQLKVSSHGPCQANKSRHLSPLIKGTLGEKQATKGNQKNSSLVARQSEFFSGKTSRKERSPQAQVHSDEGCYQSYKHPNTNPSLVRKLEN